MRDLTTCNPTTLDGIKRLAKQIKKRDGIIHADALHQAARQAGFTTYADAQRTIDLAFQFKGGHVAPDGTIWLTPTSRASAGVVQIPAEELEKAGRFRWEECGTPTPGYVHVRRA